MFIKIKRNLFNKENCFTGLNKYIKEGIYLELMVYLNYTMKIR